MATTKAKVEELLKRFGIVGEGVVKAAAEAQKQADEKADWKEFAGADAPANEALKAKKQPALIKIEVESEEEVEGDEMEDEEDVEMKHADIDFADDSEAGGNLDAWDGESEAGDFYALGDVDVKEYGKLMAEVMAEAVTPIASDVTALKEAIEEMRQFLGRTKDHQEEGVSLALEAAKEHETRLKSLERENQELRKGMKDALLVLKELQSDLPSGIGGFVASQAKETELSEAEAALKEGPQADPLSNFMSFVLQNK